MLDNICTIIGVYTDVFVFYIFLSQFKLNAFKMRRIILFIVFGLINIIMNIFEAVFIIKLCIGIVAIVILIMLTCEIMGILSAIKCAIAFYTFLGIGELLVVPIMILVEGVYDIDLFYANSITSLWVITLIISRILAIILIKLSEKYHRKDRIEINNTEKVLIYFPLIFSFLVAVIIEHYLINIERFDMDNITFILVILAIVLMAFTITYMKFLERSILTRQQEKQIIELEHRNEMQYLFYEEKNKYENEIRRIRHDLKNHLLLIKDNNQIGNSEYYNKMLNIVDDERTINSGCNVFDILINEKKKVAENSKIAFKVSVEKNISCINYIEERDLCSILGNIIDNAIENTLEEINACVDVKVDIINYFFYMRSINTYNCEKIRKTAGKFLTTKQDYNIHGIGLSSVKNALEKYDGYMKITHGECTFNVEIMIPIKTDGAK